jgi:hypothetical protein
MRLLAQCPTGIAMSRLWALHTEADRNPDEYLWENEHRSSVYSDSFGAMKACVRLNPAWLEQAIADADPTQTPVHDLGYLIANLGDQALWSRCKNALRAKADEAHERSIATCIFVFRDAAEQEWLEKRVTKQKDMVGPVSLRALAVINPQRALTCLTEVDDAHLYVSRNWCFLELYLRLPNEVMRHIAGKLPHHPDPWRYALVLQGREDAIDTVSFDFLLDRLSEMLAAVTNSGEPENLTPGCRTGFSFMKAVCRPDLLQRLRARRGTALEDNLVAWLLAVGPQAGSWREHDKHEGLEALAKIGGEGFSRVLHDWLERGDWYGRYHAVELAQRRVTPKTIELLTELTRTDEPADKPQRTVLWGHAAAALATQSVWDPVFDYYLRVGMESLTIVDECAPEPNPPLDDPTVDRVLKELRKPEGTSPGAVLAVGLSERADLLPEVRGILSRAEPASAVAGACLVALRNLGDTDPISVPVVVRCLPYHTFHAINALLSNGSNPAVDALIAVVQQQKDLLLATTLANIPRSQAAAIQAIRAKAVSDTTEFRLGATFLYLGARLSHEALRALADIPEIITLAEEVAFNPPGPSRLHGVKPSALRLIAVKQPEPAFETAIARLRNPEVDDKELYVRLIGDFFPERAIAALLDVLLLEPPANAVHCIGCQLQRLNAAPAISSWLSDTSVERRIAACRLAAYQPTTEELRREVFFLGDDPDNRVSDAATKAAATKALEQLLPLPLKPLDALIATADPGMAGSQLPWGAAIQARLTPAMNRYLSKQVEERRKKFLILAARERHRSGTGVELS